MCVYTLLPLVNCQPLLHPWTQTFLQSKWWYNATITKKGHKKTLLRTLKTPFQRACIIVLVTLTASCFLFASHYYHMVWCSVTLPQTTQRYPSHPTPSTYSSTLLHPFYHQNYPHHDSPSIHLTMTPSSGSYWEAVSYMEMRGKCRHYISKKLPMQKIWEQISQKVQ